MKFDLTRMMIAVKARQQILLVQESQEDKLSQALQYTNLQPYNKKVSKLTPDAWQEVIGGYTLHCLVITNS